MRDCQLQLLPTPLRPQRHRATLASCLIASRRPHHSLLLRSLRAHLRLIRASSAPHPTFDDNGRPQSSAEPSSPPPPDPSHGHGHIPPPHCRRRRRLRGPARARACRRAIAPGMPIRGAFLSPLLGGGVHRRWCLPPSGPLGEALRVRSCSLSLSQISLPHLSLPHATLSRLNSPPWNHAGAIAMGVQVVSLLWLRTIMNYQYRYGGTFGGVVAHLYKEGGLRRCGRRLLRAVRRAACVGANAASPRADSTKGWARPSCRARWPASATPPPTLAPSCS